MDNPRIGAGSAASRFVAAPARAAGHDYEIRFSRMLILFCTAIALNALLLFLVQPMFAKMALPLLGGSPAVWTTCMVFFQAALLAGYAYAHVSVRRLGVRRQAMLHVVLPLLPLLVLPIDIARSGHPGATAAPIVWLLRLLASSVGI